MARTSATGIEIEYETFGDPGAPPLLLVMGLGAQLLMWDEQFCEQLAGQGFRVIRYDNRDVGLSTRFDDAGIPDILGLVGAALGAGAAGQSATASPPSPPYTLDDMADDGVGLLDALGIPAAHVVGASMGGMIAQLIAIRHPQRVLSLCSIMSTTGDPLQAPPSNEALAVLMQPPPQTREGAIDRAVEAARAIGSPGFPMDAEKVRERAARAYDRSFTPEGTIRQLAATIGAADRTAALGRVSVPTLVIHGEDDPLVRVSGGQATARAVPGAELLLIPGMGHDLPIGAWPTIIGAITTNAHRAAAGAAAAD